MIMNKFMSFREVILIVLVLAMAVTDLNAQGYIFLFKDFTPATFHMKDRSFAKSKINVDTKGQKIYYIQDENIMELTNLHKIDTIAVGPRRFVMKDGMICEYLKNEAGGIYINWKLRDSYVGKEGAMGLTTQGKIDVMQIPGLDSKYSINNMGKYEDETDVWTIHNENNYIFKYNGREYRFRRLAELYKAFPEKAEGIKSFVRENNITLKSTAEAVRVIYYIYGGTGVSEK